MDVLFDTPLKWYELSDEDYYILTRNGIELDRISFKKYQWKLDTIPGTEKPLYKNHLLHEYLNMFLNTYKNTGQASRINILNKKVILLDSIVSGMAEFEYQGTDGIDHKGFLVCCPQEDFIYILRYEAVSKYYYDLCKKTAYSIIETLEFNQ